MRLPASSDFRIEDTMRATEFLHFLNAKGIPDDFEFSHLEIKEKHIDEDGKVTYRVKETYKKIRREFISEKKNNEKETT